MRWLFISGQRDGEQQNGDLNWKLRFPILIHSLSYISYSLSHVGGLNICSFRLCTNRSTYNIWRETSYLSWLNIFCFFAFLYRLKFLCYPNFKVLPLSNCLHSFVAKNLAPGPPLRAIIDIHHI